jgi:LuxR family transcriptional regulator, maltose regulon positive regulatory protein
LVRVLLAQAKSGATIHFDQAIKLLERLLLAAKEGGRMGSVIEFLVLQGLANHTFGHTTAALTALEQALKLAGPEGYSRVFLDEGVAMSQLLLEAGAHKIMPNFVGKLLKDFEAEQPRVTGEPPLPFSFFGFIWFVFVRFVACCDSSLRLYY